LESTPEFDAIMAQRTWDIERLCRIKGVGPATAERLVDTFGSIHGVVRASWSELAKVEGFSDVRARGVQDRLYESDIDAGTGSATLDGLMRAVQAEMVRKAGGDVRGWLVINEVYQHATQGPGVGLRVVLKHEDGIYGDKKIHTTFKQGAEVYADLLDHAGLAPEWQEVTPCELVRRQEDTLLGTAFEHAYHYGFALKINGEYHHI
jgi:hypothetical protein